MPSLYQAHLKHARHYARVTYQAEELYKAGDAQTLAGLALFDAERLQIDSSWLWIRQQATTPEIDTLLLAFADATAYVGELRYDARRERIPQLEALLVAARRVSRWVSCAAHPRPSRGSIYQREDGHWCGSVDLGYSTGKRRRKVIYGRTRKEVADKLKVLYRDQAIGANLATPQQTVKAFLEYWLEHTVKRKNRVRTYDRYKADVDNYLIPALGKIQLSKLAPDHVQELLNALYDRGLAYRTICNVRAALRAALTQAVRKRYLTWNVAKLVDIPGEVTFIAQPLTEEQVRLFLTIIQGHRLEALYHIALGLGLRKGEILGLRWEDVDLDRAVICITGALQRQNGRLERSATKTEASVRVLALPPNQVVSLRWHQARQHTERTAAPRWQTSGMVFTSTIGTPLAPETLSQHFKATLNAAGLPIIRFHDLRHTCATLMLKRGVAARLIQEVLGHSQITTTMNTYTHVLEEVQREAVTVLDALFTTPKSAIFRHKSRHTGGM